MKRSSFETRIALLALAGGLPALLAVVWLLTIVEIPVAGRVLLFVALVLAWLAFAARVHAGLTWHLNTLSNLLEALREEDYSLRSRRAREIGALGDVFREVNQLSKTLREQRVQAREASALLRKVLAEIDIAVFAFDGAQRLMLVNRAGERLMQAAPLGSDAAAMGLDSFIAREGRQIVATRFPSGTGRWDVWSGTFREAGLPHYLLVISDLSRALREEERKAWQRLVRVMGHELNNSLTPIKSMASTLRTRIAQGRPMEEMREDIGASLDVIASRAESLGRFIAGYTMLARLPAPRRRPTAMRALVARAASLDKRLEIRLDGEDVEVPVDPDQIEQLLINLVKNAVDAAGETGAVSVHWYTHGEYFVLEVFDSGPGLDATENLFVPFFTTKPGGTGIGLVLSRQIAEAHEGALTLENRSDQRGCVARLELPL